MDEVAENLRLCSICKKMLLETEEYFYKNNKNCFGSYCKQCSKEKARRWALNNPEKYLTSHRKSRAKNKLKIRE